MRRGLALGLLTACLVAGAAACAAPDPLEAYARPQRLVKLPDGRTMNLYCTGKAGPLLILDAGLGGSTFSWGSLQPKLAGYRACAYDRAGMGFSDPGPLPRDAEHRVADLRALLKAARLAPPYILVGHSLGGLDARLYAFKYPKEVAGLVLVDPAVEHQDERISAALGGIKPPASNAPRRCLEATEAGLTRGTPAYDTCVGRYPDRWPASLKAALAAMRSRPDFFRAEVSELESLEGADSAQMDRARHSLGDLPMVVLTAENSYRTGIPPQFADMLSALWTTMHDEVAKDSTRGENRLVRGAGHLIQNDDPEAVATAIGDVAAKAGKR